MKKIVVALVIVIAIIVAIYLVSRPSEAERKPLQEQIAFEETQTVSSASFEVAQDVQSQTASGEVVITTSMLPNFSDSPEIGTPVTNTISVSQ